ncbi:hypothetical protein BWI15_01160 [Kribbella sp. ALI-6-A]|nr:hypothetical protein BWI15_01160 [Kribbella sp. ALI-6-A]
MGRLNNRGGLLLNTDDPGALMLAGLRTQVGDLTFRENVQDNRPRSPHGCQGFAGWLVRL